MDLVVGFRQPRRGAALPQQRRSGELRVADARRSGAPSERAALIEELMPLARSLARGFRTTRDSHDDLVQVACLGLVEAFDRFDPERGTMFSSFAVPTIMGALRRHLRDRTWRVHVPRDLRELSVALGPVAEALSRELRRSPTDDELASRLRVSPEAISEARQAADAQVGRSLDEPAHAGARASLAETLGGEDRELDRTERVVVLESWLAALPERPARVPAPAIRGGPDPARDRRTPGAVAGPGLAASAPVASSTSRRWPPKTRSAASLSRERSTSASRRDLVHEVFHSLVILAAASHFAAMAGWIIPNAA
jgi:RNA polymerase sigma-B factor